MEWKVCVLGSGSPEGLLDENLARSIRDVVFPANDVRDAHVDVVHYYRKMVERIIFGSRNDKILELRGIERDVSADNVGKSDDGARILQPDGADHFARLLFTFFFGYIGLTLVYQPLQSTS